MRRFLAHIIQSRIDPAKSLNIVGVYTDTDAHACLADPNVVSSEVRIEIKVFEDGVVWAQKTGKRVLPKRNLVKGLRHLHKAIYHKVDLATLDVEEADI